MIAPFLQGFGTGGGLIVAIGAQNAFVLSQGVRRNHHLVIAVLCILCDAVFITAGVIGFGRAISASAVLSQVVAWGGAGFLFVYGVGSLRSALRGGRLDAANPSVGSFVRHLAPLAVSLLNPHFYLDTVFPWAASAAISGESRLISGRGRFRFHTMVSQPEPRRQDAGPSLPETHRLARSRQSGVRHHVDHRRHADHVWGRRLNWIWIHRLW